MHVIFTFEAHGGEEEVAVAWVSEDGGLVFEIEDADEEV